MITKVLREDSLPLTLSTIEPMSAGLGSNCGLCGERLVTNCQS